jgi:hypothetical protein
MHFPGEAITLKTYLKRSQKEEIPHCCALSLVEAF